MIDPIEQRYWLEIERIDPFKATDVVTILIRIRTTLMMGIDAAVGAEVVLRHLRVELVDLERLLALDDIDPRQSDRSDDRAFPTADGAIATTGVDDAIGQFKFKDDRATMA